MNSVKIKDSLRVHVEKTIFFSRTYNENFQGHLIGIVIEILTKENLADVTGATIIVFIIWFII